MQVVRCFVTPDVVFCADEEVVGSQKFVEIFLFKAMLCETVFVVAVVELSSETKSHGWICFCCPSSLCYKHTLSQN